MARLSKIEDIDFPVKEQPVYVITGNGESERRILVRDKKALVNDNNQRVQGIVSKSYRLVSNAEAMHMAYQCCQTVFPETSNLEWEINQVDAPSTAGYCHIDLVHKTSRLDFQDVPADQKPDIFGPFIRVTNSFNGLRALGFDIGFYRKVCKNGLILPETIIRFKFSHSRQDIGQNLEFRVEKDRLDKLKNTFTQSMDALRACAVDRPQFERLVCSVLQLRPPKQSKRQDVFGIESEDGQESSQPHPDWQLLQQHLSEMNNRYIKELGSNAYAAFNAVTEFASRPLLNRCVHRDRHSMQRLAGSWLAGFNASCRQPDFSINGHLDQMEEKQANIVV
jgi:hypothetical protein